MKVRRDLGFVGWLGVGYVILLIAWAVVLVAGTVACILGGLWRAVHGNVNFYEAQAYLLIALIFLFQARVAAETGVALSVWVMERHPNTVET